MANHQENVMGTYYYSDFYLDGPAQAVERTVKRLSHKSLFDGDQIKEGGEPNRWHANGFADYHASLRIEKILSEAALCGVSSDWIATTTDGDIRTEASRFGPVRKAEETVLNVVIYEPEAVWAWEAARRAKNKAMRVIADALMTEPVYDDPEDTRWQKASLSSDWPKLLSRGNTCHPRQNG